MEVGVGVETVVGVVDVVVGVLEPLMLLGCADDV